MKHEGARPPGVRHPANGVGHRQLVTLSGLVVALTAILSAALPAPQGVVTDLANVLGEPARQQATARIREVEQKTGAEIAVATVPSLDGMSVEEYGTKLFNEWGIGKKGSDNGVLILVAPADRRIRIEVGYGLEPILPDGLAGEIIRRDVLPQFRTESYEFGILAAVNRVAEIVEAQHVLTTQERARFLPAEPINEVWTPFAILLTLLGAAATASIGIGLKSKDLSPLYFGVPTSIIATVLALRPPVNAPISYFVVTLFGAWALAFALKPQRRGRWIASARGSSSGSSGSSGGSSSSSGSSFGGGSSGGGGASGRW